MLHFLFDVSRVLRQPAFCAETFSSVVVIAARGAVTIAAAGTVIVHD